MSRILARAWGSAALRSSAYEEVERDKSANVQAVLVVLVSSLAAALGTGTSTAGGILGVLLAALFSWIVWVLLTLVIGTAVMPGEQTRADFGEILRTTGFSSAPGIVRIFGLIPFVGWFIFFGATVWMLATFVVAIRQALDYASTGRALAVCILGWLIHAVLFFGFVIVAI